ncbi:MAG: glycosyltransferase family 2 protein [Planctomycetes bacterium]|nr:glycosyltransferase family 2 protein [Planctomycetota bacterium]
MHNKIKFSVIIDSFNQANWIKEAINSTLEQSIPTGSYEIIIIDDGSGDQTPFEVNNYKGRIRYIYKKNQGQLSCFNTAVLLSKGEYISFLDADDWWTSDKLQKVGDILDKNREIVLAVHAFYDHHQTTGTNRLITADVPAIWFIKNRYDMIRYLDGVRKSTSLITFRRQFLEMLFPVKERQDFIADAYMTYLAPFFGAIGYINTPLAHYRIHDQNLFTVQSNEIQRQIRRYHQGNAVSKLIREKIKHFNLDKDSILYTALSQTLNRYLFEFKHGNRFEYLSMKLRTTDLTKNAFKKFVIFIKSLLSLVIN